MKKFKLFSILSIVGLLGIVLTLSQPIALANSSETTTVLEQKESIVEPMTLATDTTEVTEEGKEGPLFTTYGVDKTETLSLGVGKGWSTSFKMNNWINSDHNAFNVKISNVSGKYKYIINGSNGYQYESSEMTSGGTWTTSHANLDVTYTVTIVNTGASSLDAKVNITSFIQ